MGQLDGKVAIITGAGSGMGRTMSLRFAEEGAMVVAVDCAGDSAEKTVKALSGVGGKGIAVRAHVSRSTDLDGALKAAIDTFGGVDIPCNNPGIHDMAGLMDDDWDTWDYVLQAINLRAVAMFSQKVAPEMVKRGNGAIVNTASVASLAAQADGLSQGVSGHGVVGITRQIAIEFGPKRIRVNAICHGALAKGMTTDFVSSDGFTTDKGIARRGKVEEIAKAALFLAPDVSSFMTGVSMPVDGDWGAK